MKRLTLNLTRYVPYHLKTYKKNIINSLNNILNIYNELENMYGGLELGNVSDLRKIEFLLFLKGGKK